MRLGLRRTLELIAIEKNPTPLNSNWVFLSPDFAHDVTFASLSPRRLSPLCCYFASHAFHVHSFLLLRGVAIDHFATAFSSPTPGPNPPYFLHLHSYISSPYMLTKVLLLLRSLIYKLAVNNYAMSSSSIAAKGIVSETT